MFYEGKRPVLEKVQKKKKSGKRLKRVNRSSSLVEGELKDDWKPENLTKKADIYGEDSDVDGV